MDVSAANAPLRLTVSDPNIPFPINRLREDLKNLSVLAPETNIETKRSEFSNLLDKIFQLINESVPQGVRFELQSYAEDDLLFDVERALSDMPWDNLAGPNEEPIFAHTSVSRVIRTSRIEENQGPSGRMTAVVFAAKTEDVQLHAAWRNEQKIIVESLKAAGVSDIQTNEPDTAIAPDEFLKMLDGADIYHLIGHAAPINSNDGGAEFWLSPEASITSEFLSQNVPSLRHKPTLVFLNACGSTEERKDLGGSVIAGLATPFLEVGSIVVGTQWPVQTLFATQLATEFYGTALPPPNSLFWRWIRRKPLQGVPIAEALSNAKRALYQRRPYTDPTWSAYIVFGNPTARIALY